MRTIRLFPFVLLLALGCKNTVPGETNDAAAFAEKIKEKDSISVTEFKTLVVESKPVLTVTRQIGDLSYQAHFRPAAYMALKESEDFSVSNLDSLVKGYEGAYYFAFEISAQHFHDELLRYKVASAQDYQARIAYFSFGIQHDFMLVAGSDTLPCSMHHFERVYGVSSKAMVNLAFGRRDPGSPLPEKDFTLVFTDRVFNNGILKFSFPAAVLKTPRLYKE